MKDRYAALKGPRITEQRRFLSFYFKREERT